MAFRIVALLSVLVVLAQGSQLPSAGQVSTVGSRHSGIASYGSGGISAASPGHSRPVVGSAVHQPQRPLTTHGSVVPAPVGSTRRHQSALPVQTPRQQASGLHQRIAGGHAGGTAARPRLTVAPVSPIRQPQVASGHVHQNRNPHQKPY